jgi:hypothetical protein
MFFIALVIEEKGVFFFVILDWIKYSLQFSLVNFLKTYLVINHW